MGTSYDNVVDLSEYRNTRRPWWWVDHTEMQVAVYGYTVPASGQLADAEWNPEPTYVYQGDELAAMLRDVEDLPSFNGHVLITEPHKPSEIEAFQPTGRVWEEIDEADIALFDEIIEYVDEATAVSSLQPVHASLD